jgi:hypothetical protein
MPLFTIIMEFDGTTSASQFRTNSPLAALQLWLEQLSQPNSFGLTDAQRSKLAEGSGDPDLNLTPVALEGLQNIWCSTVSGGRRKMALLNIIETVEMR